MSRSWMEWGLLDIETHYHLWNMANFARPLKLVERVKFQITSSSSSSVPRRNTKHHTLS